MSSATRSAAPARLRMALEAPERVDRLVLLGPGGIDTSRRPPTEGLLHLLDYYSGEGPTREKFETVPAQGSGVRRRGAARRADRRALRGEHRSRGRRQPAARASEGSRDARALDLTLDPPLGGLKKPTLVLWGVEDRVNPASGGRSLQERMPNCDLYLFSRTGHWVQWERAAEFNAATIAFLSQ